MSRGIVLVRSSDPGMQLQALRTALSLSLGDRPADLLVAGDGLEALRPEANSEAEHCLQTLRQMSLGVEVDQDVARSLVHPFAEVLPHADFVDRLATAAFVQVF
jgi:hypothetical protein